MCPNLNPRASEKECDITILHGPSGAGKTYVAGTLSKHFVVRPPAERTSMLTLDDLLWVQFDRTGLQTLHSLGLDPHYEDLSAQPVDAISWVSAVMDRLDAVTAYVKDHAIGALVVDTISTPAAYLDAFFLSNTKNPQLAYGRSQAVYRQLMGRFRAMRVPQVWLCHSKTAYVSDEDQAKELRDAQRLASRPFEYDVDLALTRGNADYVRPISNLTTFLMTRENRAREFVLREGGSGYCKNRYGDLLPSTMPADFRQLFSLIEQAESRLKGIAVDKAMNQKTE